MQDSEPETGLSLMTSAARSDWVRLRTLTMLRWFAIAGQTGAILVASLVFDMDLRLDICGTLVAISAGFNIISTLVLPENKRLSERDTAMILLFDLSQLCALLATSGGLTNPFALLVLVPITISATALSLRTTLLLGGAALVELSLIALFHLPLRFADGSVLILPALYIGGTWAALVIGLVFIGVYARRVAYESFTMSQALLATQLALSREQRLTALGGLIAAAAHELGTPLATIKLTSTELAHDLVDHPDLREDVLLIRDQTDRCRDILRGLGRAGKDDMHLRHAPVSAVVEEAAEPHIGRGKRFILRVDGTPCSQEAPDQPEINRLPELVHGLRNLIQNAVDFAAETVWVDIDWDDETLRIAVGDDGSGYSPDLLGRLGDPFLRRRGQSRAGQGRPGYEGMGLGLFIAKTLLERSGARLTFANGSEDPGHPGLAAGQDPTTTRPPGALVEVVWPRARLEAPREAVRGALGDNQPFGLNNI